MEARRDAKAGMRSDPRRRGVEITRDHAQRRGYTKLKLMNHGLELVREPGDPALSHESVVTHHIRRLLRLHDSGPWVRMYPDREGLTSCRQGVTRRDTGVCYWHERYQIEAAHRAFNAGCVYYSRA